MEAYEESGAMHLIDTHTHLYLEDFESDIQEVMARAKQAGVQKFYLPAIDRAHTRAMESLEAKYPKECFLMAGLHPCSVKEDYEEELRVVFEALSKRKFAAIGEVGLDFYWDKTFVSEQYKALETQINWALQYQLPLVLHTRNATAETLQVIASHKGKGLKGIFHCFSGTLEQARQIIDQNFLLGIGGVVTFKNSGLGEIVREIPLEYQVLETDAPYLAPVPFRGKRNESSYLTYIAARVAEIKNVDVRQVAQATTRNAEALFARAGQAPL